MNGTRVPRICHRRLFTGQRRPSKAGEPNMQPLGELNLMRQPTQVLSRDEDTVLPKGYGQGCQWAAFMCA
jgi:hypothetical protein